MEHPSCGWMEGQTDRETDRRTERQRFRVGPYAHCQELCALDLRTKIITDQHLWNDIARNGPNSLLPCYSLYTSTVLTPVNSWIRTKSMRMRWVRPGLKMWTALHIYFLRYRSCRRWWGGGILEEVCPLWSCLRIVPRLWVGQLSFRCPEKVQAHSHLKSPTTIPCEKRIKKLL